jgi:hypothetical protein
MIRQVRPAGMEIETSCLGFGCASLGSRISPAQGRDALARAFDAGVLWYDVAPPYGGGEAEGLLGAFLKGRRDRVSVLTKVGLAPPQRAALVKLAYRFGRPAAGLFKGLRARVRGHGTTRLQSLVITPELIETSLAASLKRLGTDRVEVFALHDPTPASVIDESVLRALERVVASGRALHVAVAGDLEACHAGAAPGLPYRVFQTAIRPGLDIAQTLAARAQRPVTVIGHSLIGVAGTRDRLIDVLRADPAARARIGAAGYDASDVAAAASALLLDSAFATHRDGIVLASMFSARHLAENTARASRPIDARSAELLTDLLASSQCDLEMPAL